MPLVEKIFINNSIPHPKYEGWTTFYYKKDGVPMVISGGICPNAKIEYFDDGPYITVTYEVTKSGMPKKDDT